MTKKINDKRTKRFTKHNIYKTKNNLSSVVITGVNTHYIDVRTRINNKVVHTGCKQVNKS
jgi:hypothetical protein